MSGFVCLPTVVTTLVGLLQGLDVWVHQEPGSLTSPASLRLHPCMSVAVGRLFLLGGSCNAACAACVGRKGCVVWFAFFSCSLAGVWCLAKLGSVASGFRRFVPVCLCQRVVLVMYVLQQHM